MIYAARCDMCGEVEIEKPMQAPFPKRHECGYAVHRVYTATPAHYNAPGFYASDVTRFKSQVGAERFAKFEKQKESAERRAKAGKLTNYEKALER